MKADWITRMAQVLPEGVKEAAARGAMRCARFARPSDSFEFAGERYPYFYQTYNLAWRNERTVEVPIALAALDAYPPETVLELGNVLSYYASVRHEVLDKYERGEGIINEDAVDFHPDRRYRFIVSVSTLEHVGWDEVAQEPGKARRAIENLLGLLEPGGTMLITVPVGENGRLDALMRDGDLRFVRSGALRRVSKHNEWREVPVGDAWDIPYDRAHPCAGAVVVGVLAVDALERRGASYE